MKNTLKSGGGSRMKAVVHLGFPKTASSTLQFGPLLELDRAGIINLMTWRKGDVDECLDDRPSSRLFRGLQMGGRYSDLQTELLNVLSDESFTAPIRLRKCNFGEHIVNPIKFPSEIRRQLIDVSDGNPIEFHWVIVIRRQASLIASQYVEEYSWKRFKGIDLLFNKNGAVDLSGYEIYNFSEYIEQFEQYKQDYGDKLSVLLYEDMLSEGESFFSVLDNIFDVEAGVFSRSFLANFHNAKKKSKLGTFTKDNKYFVPSLRDEVLDVIDSHFMASNKGLVKYFSKEKLLRYGYIRS